MAGVVRGFRELVASTATRVVAAGGRGAVVGPVGDDERAGAFTCGFPAGEPVAGARVVGAGGREVLGWVGEPTIGDPVGESADVRVGEAGAATRLGAASLPDPPAGCSDPHAASDRTKATTTVRPRIEAQRR